MSLNVLYNEKMFRRFLVIMVLFLPAFTSASELPEYHLDISFDIQSSKITGVARIDARSKDITVNIGQLKILDVSVDKQRIPFDIQKGILIALPVSKNEPYSGISDMLKKRMPYRKKLKI